MSRRSLLDRGQAIRKLFLARPVLGSLKLASSHAFPVYSPDPRIVALCGLPGTNLVDEWIGDLPLIAEVVASQLAKITCPTGRQYIETGSNGNPHPPAP